MKPKKIKKLVKKQKPGYSLDQAFYRDPDIYQREIDRIYLRSWLYAGHQSEIPNVGDYLLFNFDRESVIILRSSKDEFQALLNVCRHRGSRICLESSGHAKRLVCPYHAWVYDLEGKLLAARTMPEDFDLSNSSLKRIQLRTLDGMIFVNFSPEPAPFDHVVEAMTEPLAPYRISDAKVAHRESYPIESNWKLAVENYSECYHCAPSHPEYSRGHGLAIPESRYSKELQDVMGRAAACGLSEKVVNNIFLEAVAFGADMSYERYPMLRGHVTGSRDGKPVAPLMGDIRDYDSGTTDIQVGPVTFGLAYCDHIVLYRFTPLSIDRTDCDITWLVNGDAEEGRDYSKEELTWLWDITTIADKTIIEDNQAGVNSRYYTPGPFSKMEDFTVSLIDWYLDTMR
jgi:Rieske 2Fe-2S family protein